MPVDALTAQWLQAESDWAVRTSLVDQARWGASARTIETPSGLATRAGAEAEGASVAASGVAASAARAASGRSEARQHIASVVR